MNERLSARRVRREKRRLIDIACDEHGATSIVDCGGVWNVDGTYTFHALERWPIERAVLIDTHMNEAVRRRAEDFPQLELIEGNFGSPEVIEQVGTVDAVLLYDVLLHQVDPDWDEVLALYGGLAQLLVVFNQQWVGADESVRLLDLGTEEFLRTVPPTQFHADVVHHLDEVAPDHGGRPFRDVHSIWQWGITDGDLLREVESIGFHSLYARDVGLYPKLPKFRNAAFLFGR